MAVRMLCIFYEIIVTIISFYAAIIVVLIFEVIIIVIICRAVSYSSSYEKKNNEQTKVAWGFRENGEGKTNKDGPCRNDEREWRNS